MLPGGPGEPSRIGGEGGEAGELASTEGHRVACDATPELRHGSSAARDGRLPHVPTAFSLAATLRTNPQSHVHVIEVLARANLQPPCLAPLFDEPE
jgi:hypothetical protein